MSAKTEPKCLKGINYGDLNFDAKYMSCSHKDSTLFKLPLSKITNSTFINKSEVLVELDTKDEQDNDQVLCEFRFFSPNEEAKSLNEKILGKLPIKKQEIEDEIIAKFEDLKFQIPRGKYSLSFSDKSIKFHGNTFNFKTDLKNIGKVYLLPKAEKDDFLFIIFFKQPIRQGSTRYSYFIILLEKEEKIELKINLSADQLKEKYNEPLESEYEGSTYEIFTKLFKIITNLNIVIPGNFQSSEESSCVKCSVRNIDGHLYFLQKSLIFLPKANIFFKIDDIKVVEYFRIDIGAKNKFFDLNIKKKDSVSSVLFIGLDKKEYDIIEKYFSDRNVPTMIVKESIKMESQDEYEDEEGNNSADQEEDNYEESDDDDDEDDEDFNADEVENEET